MAKPRTVFEEFNELNITEGSIIAAYFISPEGQAISTKGGSHIATIINDPETFGVTKEYIKGQYAKYNEKLGVEDNAREAVIKNLIDRGWIRLRRYPNKFWSVQVSTLSKKAKDYLQQFASKILHGVYDFKETDKYMAMRITADGNTCNHEIWKIASDVLYTVEELNLDEARFEVEFENEQSKINEKKV